MEDAIKAMLVRQHHAYGKTKKRIRGFEILS